MALKSNAVWAIDIGNNSLKALHLSVDGDVVRVAGFDNIQHNKILSGSGVTAAESDELIALTLRQFVRDNNLDKDEVVVSVPSQNSFARFVNLPPVAPKRIPEIVKFEAAQQIPFDINDVQWDWQLMTEEDSTENKVGIFAIKSDVVGSALEHFSRENIQVSYVQMAPMALYNYVVYDRPDLLKSDSKATVALNIGAENTDLVVCTKSSVWQRSIPMGGNAFTSAIASTFKLNFEKAEKLKRTAPMSKYARQIFQAMRPVFTDLASEVQRSLGFYNSSNPNTKLVRVIALGGGTKMRGLLKYLQQTLQLPVERPDAFKKLTIGSGTSAAKFHESVGDFGVVYGLALQGLGMARIESNLLPRSIARSMSWAGKAKYFTAAAVMLLLVAILGFARTSLDKANYGKHEQQRRRFYSVIQAARDSVKKLKEQQDKGSVYEEIIKKQFDLYKHRGAVPLLIQTILSALSNENNNPEQTELYRAFKRGDVQAVLRIPRKERKQIFITNMSISFADDVDTTEFDKENLIAATRARTSVRTRTPTVTTTQQTETEQEKEIEQRSGFLVTIEGYSPYKNISALMDPAGVRDDKSKWGFITWLSHLDDIVDGNSPLKLYKKTEFEHFQYDDGEVDLNTGKDGVGKMPSDIGLIHEKTINTEYGQGVEQVLIDPMTKEIISKIPELDENGRKKIDRNGKVVYKINDHWFRLNVKFLWKDAPKQMEQVAETRRSYRRD